MATLSGRAYQQSDAPKDYWNAKGPKIEFGQEEFRVLKLGSPRVNLSDYVEGLTWTEDETGIPTGDLTLRTPGVLQPYKLNGGEVIRCDSRKKPGGAYSEVWRMRVSAPERAYGEGGSRVSLANDLALLQASEDDFVYKRDHKHPHGWRFDQIIVHVAKRYGIKKVVCPKGKHRIKNLTVTDEAGNVAMALQASPLDVILSAVKAEMNATKKNYHVRLNKGVLYVLPRRRSKLLIALGPAVISAALAQTLGRDDKPFASALTVRNTVMGDAGKDAKGHTKHKPRKIAVKLRSANSVKKYGYVHRNVFAPDADTRAEASKWGKAYLAKMARPVKTVTLSHPGITSIRRFDAFRLKFGDSAVNKKIVFVQAVTHNVQAGAYTMDLTLQFEDPFVDRAPDKIDEELEAKAATRQRVSPKKKKKTDSDKDKNADRKGKRRPTPKTNKKRQDDPASFSHHVGQAGGG